MLGKPTSQRPIRARRRIFSPTGMASHWMTRRVPTGASAPPINTASDSDLNAKEANLPKTNQSASQDFLAYRNGVTLDDKTRADWGVCAANQYCLGYTRSEERRVGKECRSRWSP